MAPPHPLGCLRLLLQYAGNVLVYSSGEPCDGDWFGGLHAGNAEAFLDALLAAKVGWGRWGGCVMSVALSDRLPACPAPQAPSGAAGEAALRPWWRGRVALSKEEQQRHYDAALRDIEDLQ